MLVSIIVFEFEFLKLGSVNLYGDNFCQWCIFIKMAKMKKYEMILDVNLHVRRWNNVIQILAGQL